MTEFLIVWWPWIAAGLWVAINILNAASKHWSERTGLVKVFLFIAEVLSVVRSAGVANKLLKMPLTSLSPANKKYADELAAIREMGKK